MSTTDARGAVELFTLRLCIILVPVVLIAGMHALLRSQSAARLSSHLVSLCSAFDQDRTALVFREYIHFICVSRFVSSMLRSKPVGSIIDSLALIEEPPLDVISKATPFIVLLSNWYQLQLLEVVLPAWYRLYHARMALI